jgi:outer membrane protein
VGLLLAMVAGQAGAQQIAAGGPTSASVAVIDVQRLVLESVKGQAALEKLRNLNEQKQAEADALQQQIRDLRARVQAGKASLPEEDLEQVEKELEDTLIEYQRFEDDAEREMQEAQASVFSEIEEEMMPIITRAGTELQYTLIFNKVNSGLLFAKDEVDITDLILDRYNAATAGGE